MRKIAAFALLTSLLLGLWFWKRPERGVPPLQVSGGVLVDAKERPVALRGMSTHGLGWYPRYLNAGAMKTLKQYGANVIRLAMYTETSSGYLEEPRNLDFVYIGIENAIAENLYVIVDWHILSDGNPLTHMEEAIAFFSEISERYGQTPNILYEICNEPNGDTTWEDITAYAAMVIPAIRKNAPEAVVLVGTPNYSSRLRDAMASPLPFSNLLYSCHKYIDVSPEAEDSQEYWLQKAVETGFPVFVTEWGINGSEGENMDLANARQFVKFLNENQISWCGWALSNAEEIHGTISPDSDKLSGWGWEDLTPGGRLMFSSFR
ncbi:MAG: glycoside hydrolase family 5 protein [Candidatus Faecousia sp.]|nr:glycoside hydrolase family 5 protein [Candidatus Faecousia sp.]